MPSPLHEHKIDLAAATSFNAENGTTTMTDDNSTTTSSPPRHARRSSFAGDTFANLFSSHRGSISRSTSDTQAAAANNAAQQPTQQYPGSISSAAAQAQRRRLSLTTLGLSGSPNQTSPFGSYHNRRDSYVSGTSDAIDESAIEDEPGASQTTPFGRRMSFGAKALRDVRTGGTSPGQNGTSKPSTVAESSNGSTAKSKAHNGTISSRDAKGRGLSLLRIFLILPFVTSPIRHAFVPSMLTLSIHRHFGRFQLVRELSHTGRANCFHCRGRTAWCRRIHCESTRPR